MIERLKGKILQKKSTEIILDCNGVGFSAFISVNSSETLPNEGEEATLYTILINREDSFELYGFSEIFERDVFKLLISISGIGPKSAMSILSSMSVPELQEKIILGDSISLQKLPGIGKKTAERIILELKDRIHKISIPAVFELKKEKNLIAREAVAALVTLGYSTALAEKLINKALSDFPDNNFTAEQLIRKALKLASS
ncbi:MAG: Holliday junction branch migration protein RuvA [Candidatus Kapabacteria bacterium]|nr:Holliday junction branch migration protein RuvA [Candidatus Kapabacteria bacterium]